MTRPATTTDAGGAARYRPRTRTMRALAVIVAGYEKLAGFSGHLRPGPVAVDRAVRMAVAQVRPEAEDVVGLWLQPIDRRWLPHWGPGAHIDVELGSGTVRQYSLCGDPGDRDRYRIAVRRIPAGTGSAEMHALRTGDELVVRGPRNAFPFVDVERYLFVAGGIGITPIRPMLHDAVRRGKDWVLVYTGRTRASMPFLDELAALDPDRVHIRPDDEFGAPDGGILSLAPAGAAVYTCGPPAMIDAIRAGRPGTGVATLHHERFSPAPVVGGAPFEVVLARSGHVVPVGASETALAAIRRVVPDIAYSCRQGFCGTCPVPLLGGPVEHRDRCLTDDQRRTRMAICVSRAADRVTLDL